MSTKQQIPISVGIFAYNEEKNIRALLESVLAQELVVAEIQEVIVISSGSFDKTNSIVRSFMDRDDRFQLVTEYRRRGKSAAINTFLQEASCRVVVSVSGDLVLDTHAIEEITIPFMDEAVGMVGAHPIPLPTDSPVSQEVALLWELHHLVSLESPKCGEMVAFRNIIRMIPEQSAVDEATLEVMLKIVGFRIEYSPYALVYNKGPKSVADFIKQRRRVYAGHQWLDRTYHYRVSTLESSRLLPIILRYLAHNPTLIWVFVRLVMIELISRSLGWYDYHVAEKNPYIWGVVKR